MKRRVVTMLFLAMVLMGAFAGPAAAQDSPPPPEVLPSSTVAVKPQVLSRTGSDVWPMVVVSLALTGAGTALVLVARRRRQPLAA